jgi:hypothetical protein
MYLFQKKERSTMRRFGFIFLSLIILAVFFAGFFLFFIPSNREAQNNYAFLVLQNIETNLRARITTNLGLISNRIKDGFDVAVKDTDRLSTDTYGLDKLNAAILKSYPDPQGPSNHLSKRHWGKSHTDLPTVELNDIRYDSLIYVLSKESGTIVVYSPLGSFFEGILRSHKNDFFQYFLLLKITDSAALPVYHSDGLNLGTEIAVDSLLTGSKNGFYQGVTDVANGNIGYKMFYVPVNLSGKHFVICGFKNAGDYQNSLHEVSSGFIYPIVIILALLLIILPLLKLYIMGADESVRVWDFIGYFFSLFAGAMFLTLVIIQVILLSDSENRIQENLHTLSGQINRSFHRELIAAYHMTEALDSIPLEDAVLRKTSWPQKTGINISNQLKAWLANRPDPDRAYYNFDKIAWADSSGLQIIKGQLDDQKPIYANVSERKYFINFIENKPNRLQVRDSTLLFTMEPVFNWADGSYRIIITKRSLYPHANIISLSTIMYSFSQSILPPGYGYCMIDGSGNVLVHSDSSHNLNENFFDEIGDNRALKGSLKARQELYIPEAKYYGKQNATLLIPVNGLPYYLITFYDKGNVQPVNMRILIFSVIFCLITFLLSVILWILLFWRKFSSKPLLFSYIDYLNWIIPRKNEAQVYFFGFVYLLIYIGAFLFVTFFTNKYAPQNNHIILLLLLQTPINVTGGLMVISGSLKNDGKGRKPLYTLIALAVLYLIYILWYQDFEFSALIQFILFEVLVLVILGIIHFKTKWLLKFKQVAQENYLFRYTLLIEALVVSLSALPAGLYTWYSHNQEILQAVKKDQLCLAFSLESRENGIYSELKQLGNAVVPARFIDSLHYKKGIYLIPKYNISHSKGSIESPQNDSGYEKFYFDFSDRISNDYYTEGFLPALRDTSRDRSWKWTRPSDSSLSFSYIMKPDTGSRNSAGISDLLNIQSEIPERFVFLSDKLKFSLLLIFIAIALYGFYLLIYRISKSVFLKKFIVYGSKISYSDTPPYFKEYYLENNKDDTSEEKIRVQSAGMIFDYQPVNDDAIMNVYEQSTIEKLRIGRNYYAYVLNKCTSPEKYLLYNFALNGFINYKNVVEIYRLLDLEILRVKPAEEEVRMFSLGFRAYVLKNYAHEGDKIISKQAAKKSSWQLFKTPFMVLLFAVAAFVFFTRQETWQRFSALIAALSSSIPLLMGFFKGDEKNDYDAKSKE